MSDRVMRLRVWRVRETGKPHLFMENGSWWAVDVQGRLFPALRMGAERCA